MDPTMNQSTRGDDALFGPQLPGRFDFTLLFEQSIFTALPCSLFLVAAMGNIYGLCKQPVRVKSGALLWLKLVSLSPACLGDMILIRLVC